ncbi:SET domain-containing protein-lysine N-methyltransferase [Gramella sp. BOM4]|nr:SET domain-containing protein-lysine N-methyltransferase [Christiangramia bathymodioli]
MIHPDTRLEWINEKKGFGVVATKLIPKGSITWVQDEMDGIFLQEEIENFKELSRQHLEKYSFRNQKGEYILCWDIAKYVNHSFYPSCLSTAYNFELAVRDIQPGEELTDDYGYLNISEPFIPEDEGAERKVVEPDDTLKCYKDWDKSLEQLFSLIPEIEQPLMELLSKNLQQEVKRIASGKQKMLSTRHLYFEPENAEFKR